MARYIENLNTCTDPTSGDYLWIVDASASASDKDRKVNVGLFPQLAAPNTFTGNITIDKTDATLALRGSGQTYLYLDDGDNGASFGALLSLGRNTNASTPAGAVLRMRDKGGVWRYIWVDATGVMRINTTPATSGSDTSGTVVGTQTSSLDSKNVREGVTDIADVLAAVQAGAEAVRRFEYKSGAFGGELFEGVVVDYAPRYGMDADEAHPAGKSLNEINILGDLLRAAANFDLRLRALERNST